MLLDVAWPDAFAPAEPEQQHSGPRSLDRRWFTAPDDLGEVEVDLAVHTAGSMAPALIETWQCGGRDVAQVRVRTLVCQHGEGSSAAGEIGGTELLTVTYSVRIGQTLVTVRTGPASAVVIGAAMVELDEIARTLNVREA